MVRFLLGRRKAAAMSEDLVSTVRRQATEGDVAGLLSAFHDARNWGDRLTVVDAFFDLLTPPGKVGHMCDRWDDPELRQEAAAALRQILRFCRKDGKKAFFFQASPNSYRDMCMDRAEIGVGQLEREGNGQSPPDRPYV
jgi:hypothetical protein